MTPVTHFKMLPFPVHWVLIQCRSNQGTIKHLYWHQYFCFSIILPFLHVSLKLSNHRGFQYSNISLLLIISVLQFQPTVGIELYPFFEMRCHWYFKQSCLLTLHTGIMHISGEMNSVKCFIISPFNQTFNSDKWLPGSKSRGVLVSKMLSSPCANKLPLGTSLIFVDSIRTALARSPSLLLHC